MMNKLALQQFVHDNPSLVTMKPAENYPGLFVLKYKRKVFYDNLWNDFLEECRGTVIDNDFNVIARPFTKIYNFGIEANAPTLADDVEVTAYRKVNGFMCSATWYKGDILLSTTGSTANDYVDYAKEMMLKHQSWEDWKFEIHNADGVTLMFECCHPSDPHIVPEDAGMYFLGLRDNTWDSEIKMFGKDMSDWARYFALSHLKCGYAEATQTTVGEMAKMAKTVKHEGFVFYTKDGLSAKIKSPYYLTSKWVARNPRTDKLVDMKKDIKHSIDEEYHNLIDAIRLNIVAYTAMSEQERLAWVRLYFS